MTHFPVILVIIGLDVTPVRCQAITYANDDLLLIETLGTNVSKIWIKVQYISFKKNALQNWLQNVDRFV